MPFPGIYSESRAAAAQHPARVLRKKREFFNLRPRAYVIAARDGIMLFLATSMLGLSPMSIKRHAIELRDRGFTVVDASEAALSQALVADAQTACSSEFSRLLDGVEKLGIDPDEELFAFSEITTRHRKRYGFQPQTPSAWTRYVEAAVGSVATPVIEALHELPPHPEDLPEQAP